MDLPVKNADILQQYKDLSDKYLELHDAYLRKGLGPMPEQGYKTSIRPHSAHIIVAELLPWVS